MEQPALQQMVRFIREHDCKAEYAGDGQLAVASLCTSSDGRSEWFVEHIPAKWIAIYDWLRY